MTVWHVSGCTSRQQQPTLQATQRFGPGELTPDAVNGLVLAFSDDYIVRLTEATDRLSYESSDLDLRLRQNNMTLRNAQSAIGIASSPNPIVAMIDMLVMVSLQREALRRTVIDRTLTEDQRRQPDSYVLDEAELDALLRPDDRVILLAFEESELEVRAAAAKVFREEQIADIDRLIGDWWSRNPHRRAVSHVRLKDFAAARSATVQTVSNRPSSIFALLQLDPLASMDPTTREIAQARMLADRLNYQLQRMPMLVSLHAKGLLYESLTTDELVSVRETLEGTQGSIARLVDAVERLPQDVEAEREAALDQFATIVASEREAAIADVEAAVSRQRDELLAVIEGRAEPMQETLTRLDTTLRTAGDLSESVSRTVRSVDEMTTRMHERQAGQAPADRPPAGIDDYQRLVDSAVDGVGGIERSLSTIDRLLAADAVDETSSRLQNGVMMATAGSREVIDHLFRRAVLLAGIVLAGWVVAAVLVRVLAARLPGRAGVASGPAASDVQE